MPNWSNPSVTEQLLFFTIRLELRNIDGEPYGAGTGFLVTHPKKNGTDEIYLITNCHVIQGAPQVVGYFTRPLPSGGPDVGSVFWVDLTHPDGWRRHPDPDVDLCALPLSRRLASLALSAGEPAYFVAPSTTMLATSEDLAALDPFMPILFVGYPHGIFDTRNFTPLLRQGVTASHPALDFDGVPEFLVDAAVFPGSSGSPVLSYERSIDGPVVDYRILGILRAVHFATEAGGLTVEDIPTVLVPVITFQRLLNLGVVIKSSSIRALLDAFSTAPLLTDAN